MDSWGTILLGWTIVLAVPALYGAWMLLRGRRLARELRLGEGDDHMGVRTVAVGDRDLPTEA
jgi:hypothetical protein